MTFPISTKVWAETMDPYDVVDYKVDLSPLLATGEAIASFTVLTLTESDLLGLTVGTSTYAPVLDAATNNITIWLSIAAGFQANAAFVLGMTLPIEISIITDSSPSRRKQRTVAVKVIQR